MNRGLLFLFIMLCAESVSAQVVNLDCLFDEEHKHSIELDLDKGWATIHGLTNSMFTVYSNDPDYQLHINSNFILFGKDNGSTKISIFLFRNTLRISGNLFGKPTYGECSLIKKELSDNKF